MFNLDDYETVEERLVKFWKEHPDGRIFTQLLDSANGRFIVQASIYRTEVDQHPWCTGLAEDQFCGLLLDAYVVPLVRSVAPPQVFVREEARRKLNARLCPEPPPVRRGRHGDDTRRGKHVGYAGDGQCEAANHGPTLPPARARRHHVTVPYAAHVSVSGPMSRRWS